MEPELRGQGADIRPRLSHFQVNGLFGQFNYSFPIGKHGPITAIIAPNGSGKTLCLRLINAVFMRRWSFFGEVDFETVALTFSSGEKLIVYKEARDKLADDAAALGIAVQLVDQRDDVLYTWRPGIAESKNPRLSLDRYIPYLSRRGTGYVHDYTAAVYTPQQAAEAFRDQLPLAVRTSLFEDEPATLNDLLSKFDCHLIETQRLLILKDFEARGGPTSSLAISKKAELLRAVISQELTAYAALSQSLDRSFPRRVIARENIMLPENLKIRLQDLEQKRNSLMQAGILDAEGDDNVSLPEGPLEPAIARVLSVYADDTLHKLSSLSRLLKRIELFKELINARFSKEVRLSKQRGFEVVLNGRNVPLEKLSSGEQHQLVLFFELLFELKENALILIDEPELSLHIAWQKKFISDLNKIIDLNKFDVILATHSPPLISRWTNLVVELGEVDDIEEAVE